LSRRLVGRLIAGRIMAPSTKFGFQSPQGGQVIHVYSESYLRDREEAERQLAANASCSEIRDIHLELAARFALLAREAKARMCGKRDDTT
jgi:hypothetical protein